MMGGKLLPFVFVLVLACFGCGQHQTVYREYLEDSYLFKVEDGEKIALVVGRYDYIGKEDDPEERVAAEKSRIEKKLNRCLKRYARQTEPPLNLVPVEDVYKLFDSSDIATQYDGLIRSDDSFFGLDHDQGQFSYLLITDIYSSHPSRASLYSAPGSGGAVIGVHNSGTKQISATVHFLDIINNEYAGFVELMSSGDQGQNAGVFIILFVPVPYFLPWWAMPEAELCDSFGKYVTMAIAERSGIRVPDEWFEIEDTSNSKQTE